MDKLSFAALCRNFVNFASFPRGEAITTQGECAEECYSVVYGMLGYSAELGDPMGTSSPQEVGMPSVLVGQGLDPRRIIPHVGA